MSVMDAIRMRESIRKYQEKPIEPEKLDQILEAGRLAPTASNSQATRVVVVQDRHRIQGLVPACCDQAFIGTAAAVLVVCSSAERTMTCGQAAATVDSSISLSFMQLQAAEFGIGSCWIGAFHPSRVAALLDIPPEYTVVAVSPLGYPAAEGRHVPYRSMDQFVVREHF